MFLLKRRKKGGKIKGKGRKDMATVKVKCPYSGSEEVVGISKNYFLGIFQNFICKKMRTF